MAPFKNRYLLVWIFECERIDLIKAPDLLRAILDSLLARFGRIKADQMGVSLSIKYFSAATRTVIIRVARDYEKLLKAGITLLSNLGRYRCVLMTVHSSGSIKAIQKKIVEFDNGSIAHLGCGG